MSSSSKTTIPTVMHAVLLTGNGGFEMLDYRSNVPVPVPGPGEVLIRVGAAGVNNTDINTRTAWYSNAVVVNTGTATEGGGTMGSTEAKTEDSGGWTGALPQFPRIQGADCCGRIVAVGCSNGCGMDDDDDDDDLLSQRIGERVLVEPVFRGSSKYEVSYFGSERDGAFAEYTCVPSAYAHRIDDNIRLTDIELASFPCSYAAAENMLTRIHLGAGDRVLITGASGGVGSATVQLAKRRGAIVTAMVGSSTTSDDEKAKTVLNLGADQVVPRDCHLVTTFGSNYFDAAVDVVGGTVLFQSILHCLKRGGAYAVAGAIAGPVVELDLRTLYLKDLRLVGCTVLEPEVFPNLIGYIQRGEIKPVVTATYPLCDIVQAQQEFLSKRHAGKIVLAVHDDSTTSST